MRQDLLHCVVAAAYGNAVVAGESVELPRHPAFRSLSGLRFERDEGAALDWRAWVEEVLRPEQARCFLVTGRGDGAVCGLRTVAGGTATIWSHPGGDAARLRAAVPEPGMPPPLLPVEDRTALLREAVDAALAAAEAKPLWTADLRRALGILASEGTGEELSDVAWPHFLIPASSPLVARRLAAAAASCWIFGGGIAADLAAEDPPPPEVAERLREAVLGALATAVSAD